MHGLLGKFPTTFEASNIKNIVQAAVIFPRWYLFLISIILS
jgi:hypothetical protein